MTQMTPTRYAMLDWLDEEIESWYPDPTSTTIEANTRYHMLKAIRKHIENRS